MICSPSFADVRKILSINAPSLIIAASLLSRPLLRQILASRDRRVLIQLRLLGSCSSLCKATAQIVVSEIILVVRLWAMYERRKSMLYSLSTFLLLTLAASLVVLLVETHRVTGQFPSNSFVPKLKVHKERTIHTLGSTSVY
jgi:hypothetical protein